MNNTHYFQVKQIVTSLSAFALFNIYLIKYLTLLNNKNRLGHSYIVLFILLQPLNIYLCLPNISTFLLIQFMADTTSSFVSNLKNLTCYLLDILVWFNFYQTMKNVFSVLQRYFSMDFFKLEPSALYVLFDLLAN